MLYILLSICCSVTVSVLLKLARRYQIDIFQAITWNYSMAIVLTWIFLRPKLEIVHSSPYYVYTLLGLLLPALFVVVAISVSSNGIIRTEIAQRLSLFIPILAAFVLFGEQLTVSKSIGMIVCFAAIICSVPWGKQRSPNTKKVANAWMYLPVVFVGMGIIDILFKKLSAFKGTSYTSSLLLVFILAFVLSLVGLFYRFGTKKSKFSWPHIIFGWILGIANFGNILFYIKALGSLSDKPSLVFSSMDIGVIVLGAVIALAIFKEKLSMINKAGIGLAVLAIVIFYFPNLLNAF
jgi:drug/metabolite transporter (DMT)-like permease